MRPGEATTEDWARAADKLQQEGEALYKTYTVEGISFAVDEERGAQADAVTSLVGGQWVQCYRGRFSRAEAARIKAERWRAAQETLTEAMGGLLVKAGYRPEEIATAGFRQRKRLLAELGNGELSRTKSGRPSRIGGVDPNVRRRVIHRSRPTVAANCAIVAIDPVEAPGLGAYQKMELADLIRMRYLPAPPEPEYEPLHFID